MDTSPIISKLKSPISLGGGGHQPRFILQNVTQLRRGVPLSVNLQDRMNVCVKFYANFIVVTLNAEIFVQGKCCGSHARGYAAFTEKTRPSYMSSKTRKTKSHAHSIWCKKFFKKA